MSDTPETDLWLKQQIVCNYEHEMVSAGFARTLERERDEARAIAKYWQEQFGHSNPEHEWQSFPWEDAK